MVVVALAGNRYHAVSRLIGTLLLTCLQSELLHPDRTREGAAPVTLYLDEFQNLLASAEQLEVFLAEGRRYRTHLFLTNQVMAQIPAALRDILRGNVYSQFVFQCGPDSKELAGDVHLAGTAHSRDDIRLLLSRQRVGEAFLLRRGEASLPIKNLPEPKGTSIPNGSAVPALREAACRAYGRPREDVELELRRREARLRETPGEGTKEDGKPTQPASSYEVRRSRPRRASGKRASDTSESD